MTSRPAAFGQGAYFVLTGLWPLVHYRSFEAATGRKREPWLAKTVGLLVTSIGATLLFAARRRARPIALEMRLLGMASAALLGAVDLLASGPRRGVYRFDAAAEAGILGLWAAGRERTAPTALLLTNGAARVDRVTEASMESFPASDPPAW